MQNTIAYYNPNTEKVVIISKWKLPFLLCWSYVYNFVRRPFVYFWKKRVIEISNIIRKDMQIVLLPELYDNMRQGCKRCGDLYGSLRGETFSSTIKLLLVSYKCQEHHNPYEWFFEQHQELFNESHELSDKICGFKSGSKA